MNLDTVKLFSFCVRVCFLFFVFLAFAHRRSFRGAPSPPVRLAHCVVFVLYLLGQRAFALYLKRSTCFFFISYKVNVRFPSMHLHYGILSSILLNCCFVIVLRTYLRNIFISEVFSLNYKSFFID